MRSVIEGHTRWTLLVRREEQKEGGRKEGGREIERDRETI